VIADDLAPPLRDWKQAGRLSMRTLRSEDNRSLELSGTGRLVRSLVRDPGALSLDVLVPRGAALELRFRRSRLLLEGRGRGIVARSGDWRAVLRPREGWASGGWRHVELTADGGLTVDGRLLRAPLRLRGPLVVRAPEGAPRVAALIATRRGDAGALLLHRLAELHARVALGEYPYGTGDDGVLHLSGGWTTGFWPGSLWRAYDLTGARLFRRWALAATRAHLGLERDQVHDGGFRYLESSAAAYDRRCRGRRRARTRDCRRLRRSAIRAADTLVTLQQGNAAAGTIPTLPASRRCRDCASRAEADTIVDSMMNVSLIEWAWRETGRDSYRTAAETHARGVARMLVRADGSTAQAVRVLRADGRVLAVHTHQGLSDGSTWSRGQAWAVYGFAYTGNVLRSAEFLEVAERAAAYVEANLPASGVPPYDYAAGAQAPPDTSAGVITAAGLFRLADACERVRRACSDGERWRPLAERMLEASLAHVSPVPPLGFLGNQVFSLGGAAVWDDRGDFIFGTDYALEAVVASADGG
jgi:unsaturated chondroitin disaccharide hydrolase